MNPNNSGRFFTCIACLCLVALLAFSAFPYKNEQRLGWNASSKSIFYSAQSNAAVKAQAIGSAIKFPKLTGRIVDNANLLSPSQERELTEVLKRFEDKSSDQIVVTTINSLNGENLEEYTNLLFREWGLGQAEENNGVLLLIAQQDRKLRIEVGYGLEANLTDAASQLIINQIIVPKFKQGKFAKGIIEGAQMIVSVLEGDIAELEARAKRNPKNSNNAPDLFVYAFIAIWVILFFGPIAIAVFVPMFGEKLGPGHYRWLGIETKPNRKRSYTKSGNRGWSSRGSSWSSGGGGGFSGGGGSSGGGGASGGW